MVKSLPLICLVNIVRVEELQLSHFLSELVDDTEDSNRVVGGGGKSGRSSVWGNDAATIQWRQLWHNAMSFNTLLDNTERSAGYNTIQYNTIQSLRQQLRSRMTSPGGDDGGALLLLGGHCHNVIVATLWPSVTSQLFSSISSSPFYLPEIIFCYCLPGGNYHNVTVATLWPSMTSQLFSSISSFPTSIFLKSSSATAYIPEGNCHNVIVALVTLCDVAMHLDHF